MKLLFFVGTRPEAIKIAPVYILFKKEFPEFQIKLCLTGQHREMLLQVIDLFELKFDYSLDVMTPGQDLFSLSSKLLISTQEVLETFLPDYVFVHGDTTTSFISALAAFYKKIKVCHIEAGLRTNNLYSPFPEEANRLLTARLADLHFAPSELSKTNLITEGISPKKIHITGNTVVDSLIMMSDKIKSRNNKDIFDKYSKINFNKKIILITNHRRENFEYGISEVFSAINELSSIYPDFEFVFPVHLNPIIKKFSTEILSDLKNVHLLDPLDYFEFLFFMNKSYLIITDSGGIQEEAPILGKPVIVTREKTERPEAVDAGISFLTGPNKINIVSKVKELIDDLYYYKSISKPNFVYGDGNASERIVNIFRESINND